MKGLGTVAIMNLQMSLMKRDSLTHAQCISTKEWPSMKIIHEDDGCKCDDDSKCKRDATRETDK